MKPEAPRAADVERVDLGKALHALGDDELRAAVVETLDALDKGPRRRLLSARSP